MSVADVPLRSWEADSPDMVEQAGLASRLWKYIFHLLEAAVLHFGYASRLYPYKFAMWLHDDAARQGQAAKEFQADFAAWQAVENLGTPFWKKMRRGASQSLTVVSEIMAAGKACGWARSPDLVSAVRRIFSHFGTSLPVELAFQSIADVRRDSRSSAPGLGGDTREENPCQRWRLGTEYTPQ